MNDVKRCETCTSFHAETDYDLEWWLVCNLCGTQWTSKAIEDDLQAGADAVAATYKEPPPGATRWPPA